MDKQKYLEKYFNDLRNVINFDTDKIKNLIEVSEVLLKANIKGKKTKKQVKLPKEIFGISPNEHAVYLDVKQYLASQRAGTHKSKERGEVQGSRRKLRKHKGSGAARVGDIKNPIFRGGGRVFGPKPRKYQLKLNKKV